MGQVSVPASVNGALISPCVLAKQPSSIRTQDLSADSEVYSGMVCGLHLVCLLQAETRNHVFTKVC